MLSYSPTDKFTVHCGDSLEVLKTLPPDSIDSCITSPPYYGLRDYGVDGQIGLEETPQAYVERLVDVFREVKRVLKGDGTLWLNIGDSYATTTRGSGGKGAKQMRNAGSKFDTLHLKIPDGLKSKDLIGIPWMLAFALRADGWFLRSEIIWHKPNPMPESVRDRPTKAHEQIFLLSKSAKYHYDAGAIREPAVSGSHFQFQGSAGMKSGADGNRHDGRSECEAASGYRNKRSVWTITPKPCKDAHFAVFPPEIPETCMLAGCRQDGTVLDCFSGAATTGLVAMKHGRRYIGIELNPAYLDITRVRYEKETGTNRANINSVFEDAA